MEAAQMFLNRWTDQENAVYTYNGMLFILKKQGNWRHAEWNKP